MSLTYAEIRREIALETAPADLATIIKTIDAAVAALITNHNDIQPIYELSRVAGRLSGIRVGLMPLDDVAAELTALKAAKEIA